jgi:dolichyl-phosphate beta-glucosyltransferase
MLMAPSTNHEASTPALSVIIPMYRDAGRIEATLADAVPLLQAGPRNCELVLVDDGSPDGTIDRVKPYLTGHPRGSLVTVRLVRHQQNLGKGAAVRTGLAAAHGSWRLIMDADNAATVRELDTLLAAAEDGVGLIAGSRVASGARVDAVATRKLAGSIFKLALRGLGLDLLADTQCGFKLYRADIAEQVVALGQEDGYAFDLEHLLIASATGLGVAEVGIRWTHREGGQVSPIADGLKMLRRAMAIRARRRQIERAVATLPRVLPRVHRGEIEPPIVVTLRWEHRASS